MNVVRILSLVSSIPAFLVHAGLLEHEATAALKSPQLAAEIAANPVVGARLAEVEAEWRTVEGDATGVKKSNILSFFPRAARFLADAGHLVRDVEGAEGDPALAAAIAKMPLLSAEMGVISAQWRAVEGDIGGLV